MRRLSSAAAAGVLIALTLSAPVQAVPAPAEPALGKTAAPPPGSGWVLIPSPSVDYPAGLTCDFAVHGDPIEDEVYYKTLTTHPDGTVRTEAATGPLVFRLTNVSTGASTEGDASASGLITHHADGALTYLLHGPILIGIRADRSNLPRGLYVIDGPAWRIHISADNYRTISGAYHIVQNVCTTLS